jgi:hypothetical protein
VNLFEVKYNHKDDSCTYVVAHDLADAWARYIGLYKPADSPPLFPQVTQLTTAHTKNLLLSEKVVQELQVKEDKKCP